jgi:hypothetical protein
MSAELDSIFVDDKITLFFRGLWFREKKLRAAF